MAILEKKIELEVGGHVTPQMLTDISETAVQAYNMAKSAEDTAKTLINEAIVQALNSEV